MGKPIYELEIANQIMKKMYRSYCVYYQTELSYDHYNIYYMLNTVSFDQKNKEEKQQSCLESLPFCQGEYLMPLIIKLGGKNYVYYDLALQVILQQFNTYCLGNVTISGESFLGQLFSSLKEYIDHHQDCLGLEEDDLYDELERKLNSQLQSYENLIAKQKTNIR